MLRMVTFEGPADTRSNALYVGNQFSPKIGALKKAKNTPQTLGNLPETFYGHFAINKKKKSVSFILIAPVHNLDAFDVGYLGDHLGTIIAHIRI